MKTASLNILETASSVVSSKDDVVGFPSYRLFDRENGLLFKPDGTSFNISIDQGPDNIIAIDRMIIPSGHTLAGASVDLRHSDDDISYSFSINPFVAEAGLINKSIASETHRYYRLIVTTPDEAPSLSELFITSTYTFERDPSRPAGFLDHKFNTLNQVTSGGQDRFLKFGEPKRVRNYSFPNIGEAQKDNLLILNEAWAGFKPFWFKDHTDTWIFGKLTAPINISEITYQRYSAVFNFMEVLP